MAHEQIIKNGLIVENSFQFKGSGVVVTGITNTGTTGNSEFKLVTENVVNNTIAHIQLANLSGVSISSPTNDQILLYSGGTWVNSSPGGTTGLLTKSEADGLYLGISGGTVAGNVTLNTLNAKTAINLTGDTTIYGNVIVSGNVDGVGVSQFKTDFNTHTGATNPHHTTVASLNDVSLAGQAYGDFLTYSGTSWVNTPSTTIDSRYVKKGGDTMTGSLTTTGLIVNGNTSLIGNLFVSGTTTTLNTNNLNVRDNIIMINSGETASGVTLLTAGLKIDRGASVPYYFIYDENSDTFRVGYSTATESPSIVTSGDTQAVATRQDAPTANGIAFWNNTAFRMDTTPNITISGNNIITTGLVDGVDISVLNTSFGTHTGATNPHNTTVASLTDVSLAGLAYGDLIYYSGSTWHNAPLSTLADSRYLQLAGGTMTGTLTATNLNVNTSLNVTGTSTMNGNIVVTGNVDGVKVSTLYTNFNTHTGATNPHNTTVASLTDVSLVGQAYGDLLYYSGSTWHNTTLANLADSRYVNTAGDTMTGDLTVSVLSGATGAVVYVDANGKLQQSVKYVTRTTAGTLAAGTTAVDTFTATLCKGAAWFYTVDDGANFRTGTVNAIWSGTTVEFTETSTNDLGNTGAVKFSADINTGSLRLLAVITGGSTWSVSTSRFMIG